MELTFAPDADPSTPGVIVDGYGLRPTTTGYGAWPNVLNYGWPALATGTTLHGMYAHSHENSSRIIVASAASGVHRLYELCVNGTTYTVTDVSKGGSTYTPPTVPSGVNIVEHDPHKWAFTSRGDQLIAGLKGHPLQSQSAVMTDFVDIAGSPGASALTTFKNFVLAGNCSTYGAVTGTKDMVAWCALGNTSSWAPSTATQAGNLRLLEVPGRIVAMKPLGDAVAVYKHNAIWLLRYIGPPTIFAAELVERRGCNINSPVIAIEDGHIFVGQDDIFLFDGANCRSLTRGRVFDYLHRNHRGGVAASGGRGEPQGTTYYGRLDDTAIAHNVREGEVLFTDYRLVYNYQLDKWGVLPSAPAEIVSWTGLQVCESAQTLIGVSNGVGASAAIDDVSMLMMPASGAEARKVFSFYKNPISLTAQTFYEMNIRAWDVGDNGHATTVQAVVPRFLSVPTGTPTMTYERLPALGATATADGAGTWDGNSYRFQLVRNAYWHRFRITFPAASAQTEVVGLQFSFTQGGKRVENPLQ